jgi:hypothetical protein
MGVPVRQWVCSLPWRLRVLCGYDSALCADVMKAFEKEVSRSLRHRATEALGLRSVEEAHTGSVLFIQRFDSALRLNVHGHLALGFEDSDAEVSSGQRRPWALLLRHVTYCCWR